MEEFSDYLYLPGQKSIPYKYVQYREHRYCWSTVKDSMASSEASTEERPWRAWVQMGDTSMVYEQKKVSWFASRASAKRRSLRMKQTHINRNAAQRKRMLCPSCQSAVKMKDDYLCRGCRYG